MDAPLTPGRPTVLVVDDTPENLSIITEALRDHYRVLLAKSGEKALALAEAQVPGLILLDVMMPEMDGWEVCRRLKANQITCGIPVLFLSALTSPEDRSRGISLGAVDFISKPIEPDQVLEKVATLLPGI
jgi:putative two-component system response regulator